MGGMSRMGSLGHGGVGRIGSVSHSGGSRSLGHVSHANGVSDSRGVGAAKRGESVPLHAGPGKPGTKVADRDVGGGMKEKAGTATHDKNGRPIGGSSYDPESGRTTSSYKNGNGTHEVTVTGKDGKVISKGTSGKEPSGGSSTFDGTKTTVVSNGDGTKTVTRTDAKGNTTATTTATNGKGGDRDIGGGMKEKAGTASRDKDGNPIGGSGYDPETGRTTSSYKNGNGTHDVTVTDKGGKVVSTKTSGKEPDGGTATIEGTTTTLVSNGDGTKTITRTDGKGDTTTTVARKPPQGASVDDGKGGWRHFEPKKEPIGGSTTFDGTTIVVTGVGTDDKTVTRTDKDGNVKVAKNPPAAPFVAAPDLGTALKNLSDAAKRYAEAKAESDSARRSLTSIVNAEQTPDVKANLQPAIDRAAQADANLKAATQDLQKALNDYNQQVAQLGRG
jgi:hypothetical protein